MAFPTSPSNGQIFENYRYNTSAGAWLKIELEKAQSSLGDDNLGTLHMVDYSNRNATSIWSQASPITGTLYLSPSLASRLPVGAKAVVLRWWVYKSETGANDWYWAGFGKGNEALPADGGTIAIGSAMPNSGVYQHAVITIPLDENYQINCLWTATGTFGSFSANVIGYYI